MTQGLSSPVLTSAVSPAAVAICEHYISTLPLGRYSLTPESTAEARQQPSTAASPASVHPRTWAVQSASLTLLFKSLWLSYDVITSSLLLSY